MKKELSDNIQRSGHDNLNRIFFTAPVGIGVVADRVIVEANESLCRLTGYSKDEMIGKHSSFLYATTEEFNYIGKENCAQITNTGSGNIEARWIKKDGTILDIILNSAPIDREDLSRGFTFTALDITERKKTEQALQRAQAELLASEARYRGLIDLAVDGILLGTLDSKIIDINFQLEEMAGRKKDELIGSDISRLFTKESLQENPFRLDLLKNGQTVITKRVLARPDEIELIVETHSKKMPDGIVQSIFRDITEQQKLTENLQRAQKLHSLATLAGGIAHDFNNMLGGMLGYMDLARNYSRSREETANYLDKAMTVFDRAKNLTAQLTTFAHGGAPSLKTGNIGPVLREYTLSALKDSNFRYTFDIPENLWLIDFDRVQIGQVIYNMVVNARDFIEPGGKITVSAKNIELTDSSSLQLKPGGYIKVEITDNGIGIPDKILPRIFDPFFTTKKKGNGLGLSTSYSIITRHGGLLDVESVYGEGSRFWFYLPASLSQGKSTETEQCGEHHGTGIILVMDDEYFMREIMSQMLKQMGYRTVQATDGREMLAIYKEYKDNPELKCVILDLTIPEGMSGKEAAAELRKINSDIPVFASSGYSGDRIMVNPGIFGFTDSIRKPFTINELSLLLNRHLKS